MTAQVIPFPFERLQQFAPREIVRVVSVGSHGEHLVVSVNMGWLHPSWRSAINEAAEIAADVGGAIPLDQ
jgi:hypothetical protein